jgi:hypothetical protein
LLRRLAPLAAYPTLAAVECIPQHPQQPKGLPPIMQQKRGTMVQNTW